MKRKDKGPGKDVVPCPSVSLPDVCVVFVVEGNVDCRPPISPAFDGDASVLVKDFHPSQIACLHFDLVLFGVVPEYLQNIVTLGVAHKNVDVIIPRHQTVMPIGPEQRPTNEEVSEIVRICYIAEDA